MVSGYLIKYLCNSRLLLTTMAFQQASVKRLSKLDPSSFANADEIRTKHMHLCWTINFEKQLIDGQVILDLEKLDSSTSKLILDTRDVTVHSVLEKQTCCNLKFTMGSPVLTFGSPLEITLPQDCDKNLSITIHYTTSPKASALQWLAPQQTAGKKHPFLFTQCQAIHCRSIVPCQDTPSVKATYSAEVNVPGEFVALMSAASDGTAPAELKRKTYKFRQSVPIPSYLIALCVGDLHSKKIGPRTNVWSEVELLEKSAHEFSETETMLKTAEDIAGPYVWSHYDLLVLPPSFPYGGMENPCLTFLTPTLLAGDRSLAAVVTHEIAHSWTGNLVTNANSEHFWLNEGFTMFLERKILSRMFGEEHRHFMASMGVKELQEAVRVLGETSPLTHLQPELTGVDPDDAFSTVPYEKGHTFLFYLEDKVGGKDVFEPFLKAYIDNFKYKSIKTDDFINFFKNYFKSKAALIQDIDWDNWLHTPGMPLVIPKYNTKLADFCIKLSKRWVQWSGGESDFSQQDIMDFSPSQHMEFLNLLLQSEEFPNFKFQEFKKVYDYSKQTNAEIKFRYIRLGLKARDESLIGDASKLVAEQGRMKYVKPIYRDLYNWEKSRQIAIDTFLKNRENMMSMAAYGVAQILKLEPGRT